MSGRRRTLRRWPRRILVGINVLVGVCLLSAGGVYAYVRDKIDSIHTIAAPHLTAPKQHAKDSVGSLPPENILLIGNETRSGLGTDIYGSPTELSGSLSDVIMVLHVDPAKESASILSIPRDLFVPQPAGSPVGAFQKVDAALNDGAKGPDNLIATIQDDLGIPINHYVELNFNGFQATVDDLGGINVDFPERVYDKESNLNVTTTGCQHLNGMAALALVRARHLQYDPPGVSPYDHDVWPFDPQSDLARISRDHTFLRILASTALSKGLSNPITANNFIDGLINQITVDPGLRDQLVTLATHYRHLNPATAPQVTLPVNEVGGSSGYSYGGAAVGDIEFPNQPLDNQVIAAWDGSALATPVAPTAVEVVDEADDRSVATTVAAGLRTDGLPVTGVSSGTEEASPSPTWVDYATGDQAAGLAVLADLKGAVMLRPVASLATGDVTVELGSAASVAGAGAAAAPAATGSGATGTSTTTTAPNQESTTGGSSALDPTPSASGDATDPWDPLACPTG